MTSHVAVVGGSLAGLSAVRALRAQGFDGRVTVYSGENRPPYDRPPLSKDFLAGTSSAEDLVLAATDEQLDAEWRLGVSATGLHPGRRALALDDGSTAVVDAVVVATGARARRPWPHVPAGVHVLRTLDDAVALRADLRPGASLVVVGAGFVGAETASTARGLGLDVTVVEAAPAPLAHVFGAQLGAVVTGLHADHGVPLHAGVGVGGFLAGGDGRVSAVQLADGRTLSADVVVLGVGVAPNVEWLAGTGLASAQGVLCTTWGGTELPSVVAVGDCAAWYDPGLRAHHRVEHWNGARERAAVAVRTLLSAGVERAATRPPYFWSDQYGLRLQLAGQTYGADSVTIEEGTLAEHDFVAVYRRAGVPVAALAIGQAKAFMRWRKLLAARPVVGVPA